MRAVKELANAKINLYLDVIAKRDDGFHDIKTVMHSVSLFDTITVSAEPAQVSSVKIYVEGTRFLPTDTKNLAVRAANLFLTRAALSAAVEIKLKKRIPIAAGLAGGSSDAAAVLRAMNKLFDKLFSQRALHAMAAELGSDVSYCLSGKTALCEGRGDIINIFAQNPQFFFVIAVANEYVSTPAAYKALDNIYSDFDGSVPTDTGNSYSSLIEGIKCGRIEQNALFNVFESAVLSECPGASNAKKRLIELGAKGALMSGSGPSVFGVFDSFQAAKDACMLLRREKYKAYYVKSV